MTGPKKYQAINVDVRLERERRSSWKWDNRTIRGVELIYEAFDRNFDRLNRWTFSVRVPQDRGQIVVQPRSAPGKKVFASLERRSVVFTKATKNPYRTQLYCKANLADPTGAKNRVSTKRGERSLLPSWFKYFVPQMRLKHTVTTTAGYDGESQVVLVGRDDYERMIRLFFALRIWILQEDVVIEPKTAAAKKERK
jgi:hypothetical protein